MTKPVNPRLTFDRESSLLSDGRSAVDVGAPESIPSIKPGSSLKVEGLMTKLLVDDNTELFLCAKCDLVHESSHSILAHTSHHSRTPRSGPLYSEEVIKAVLRAVKQNIENGVKRYYEQASNDLNSKKIKTFYGQEWTEATVYNIYRTYKDNYQVRIHRRRPKSNPMEDVVMTDTANTTDVRMNGSTSPSTTDHLQRSVISEINGLHDCLDALKTVFVQYAMDVEKHLSIAHVETEEMKDLRRKAARWDQFVGLTRED